MKKLNERTNKFFNLFVYSDICESPCVYTCILQCVFHTDICTHDGVRIVAGFQNRYWFTWSIPKINNYKSQLQWNIATLCKLQLTWFLHTRLTLFLKLVRYFLPRRLQHSRTFRVVSACVFRWRETTSASCVTQLSPGLQSRVFDTFRFHL
jgi:hypothetical protein